MTLKDVASEAIYDMQDGICWMILYKIGRSWEYKLVWPDVDDYSDPVLVHPDDIADAEIALMFDIDAIMVNGYYCNLGEFDSMTVTSLTNGLRRQYDSCVCDLESVVKRSVKED